MENETEIVLRKIDNDFGSGPYVVWADGETKTVLISSWGCYDKMLQDKKKVAFRCSVLNVDGREYKLGEKIIDTTSLNFMKVIKPFLLDAEKEKKLALLLEISRAGISKDTRYFIKKLDIKKRC